MEPVAGFLERTVSGGNVLPGVLVASTCGLPRLGAGGECSRVLLCTQDRSRKPFTPSGVNETECGYDLPPGRGVEIAGIRAGVKPE
jgi:hypothetical protein